MKANEYRLLSMAIVDGLTRGLHHSRKHDDHPTDDRVIQAQLDSIMLEIAEWFSFEEEVS